MSEKITPIKRSPYLVPLSRDHHEGLLLSWKIRRGIARNLQAKRIADYCLWFYENNLKEHFLEEEEGFAAILGTEDPLYILMMSDHKKIREMVRAFENGKETNYLALDKFADFLSVHIRFEERVLFNHIQSGTSKAKLEALATGITPHKPAGWKDEFWLN